MLYLPRGENGLIVDLIFEFRSWNVKGSQNRQITLPDESMTTHRTDKAKLKTAKLSVKVACILTCLSSIAFSETVTIYRDGWGVPHIYGETDRAVAFGYGYVQAKDRLAAITRNIAESTGHLSAIEGPSAVGSDFQQRLWRHEAVARRELETMAPETVEWVEAFAAGIEHFATALPNPIPLTIKNSDILSLGRFLYWRSILDQLETEMKRNEDSNPSDCVNKGTLWGLAPERSVEDAVTLAIDPAESWAPGRRWYEAHLHGPSIHAWGFTYPGLPLPVFGHNRSAGWGWLPGGPDTGDIYRLRFDNGSSNKYTWQSRTRYAFTDTFSIAVKGSPRRTMIGLTSHLGPIISRTGRVGYAYRIPDRIQAGQISQLHAMVRAENFRSFYASIRASQLGPATLLFGDKDGSLFYIRSGAVPIRPESVDWYRPVTTDIGSDWLGYHVQEDLIQIVDPHAGWIVDAGTSPDLVASYAPLTPDRFSDYIYNHASGKESVISRRLRSILRSTARVTLGETNSIVMDTYLIDSELWIHALSVSANVLESKWNADEETAWGQLSGWDGRVEPEALAPAFYRSWRKACNSAGRLIDQNSIVTRSPLPMDTRKQLVAAFRKAVKQHKTRFGHLDVRWREVHRFRSGQHSLGLPGIDDVDLKSIRSVQTHRTNVIDYGVSGQSAPTVMVFKPSGVESFSAIPFGQSDDLNSPHSWDQGEALFKTGRLKPTRFDTKPRDLKKNMVIRLPDDL